MKKISNPFSFVTFLLVYTLGNLCVTSHALETPFIAYKDGYATSASYTGNSRTLIVRSDTKAWISHAFAEGSGKALQNARIQVYVKDMVHDGVLKVYLAPVLGTLENQTHWSDLTAKDSVGAVTLRAADHIQHVVEISLNATFVKSIQDNAYAGLVLESSAGLDAELGALEGDHGAVVLLNYISSSTIVTTNSISVDSLANTLVKDHVSELRGPAGTNGSNGAKGDVGLTGPQGIKGDKGDIGPQGPIGLPGVAGKDGAAGAKGDAGNAASVTSLPTGAITGLDTFVVNRANASVAGKANTTAPTFVGPIKIGSKNATYIYTNPQILGFGTYSNSGWKYDTTDRYAGFMMFDPTNGAYYFNATPAKGTEGASIPSFSTRLALTTTGVGIGTTTPGAGSNLEVHGGLIARTKIKSDSATGLSQLTLTPGNNENMASALTARPDGSLDINTYGQGELTLRNGSVGIGTSNPGSPKLRVMNGKTDVQIGGGVLTGLGDAFLNIDTDLGRLFSFNSTSEGIVTEFGPNYSIRSDDGSTRYARLGSKKSPYIRMNAEDGSIAIYGEDGTGADFRTPNKHIGVFVQGDGKVGIGGSAPSYTLDVNGTIRGQNVAPSDVRYKQNINTLSDALEKVLALRGVTYDWNLEQFPDHGFTKDKQIGFIAQEVEPIVPEMVSTDAKGYKSLDYSKVGPILVEALKTINQKMEIQQNQINELKSENDALKRRMSEWELRK